MLTATRSLPPGSSQSVICMTSDRTCAAWPHRAAVRSLAARPGLPASPCGPPRRERPYASRCQRDHHQADAAEGLAEEPRAGFGDERPQRIHEPRGAVARPDGA
jgi:hypothetical protein